MIILKHLLNAKYVLWFVLSIPAWPFIIDFFMQELYSAEAMYRTGVISVQLLVFTLAITPVTQLLKRWVYGYSKTKIIIGWLLQRRRNFGVASFVYAVIHTMLYLIETGEFDIVWQEAKTIEYGFGWIAFVVLLPLALTSNNTSMKRLGKRWKQLQQLVYVLVVVTFIHWFGFGFFVESGVFWLSLIIVAKLVQLYCIYQPMRKSEKVEN